LARRLYKYAGRTCKEAIEQSRGRDPAVTVIALMHGARALVNSLAPAHFEAATEGSGPFQLD
jgi:hypothetical protein